MLDVLGMIGGMIFPLWPAIVVRALGQRRNVFGNMAAAWIMLLLLWFVSLFSIERIPSFLIPEPWNTILFFLFGLVLIGGWWGSHYWQRRKLLTKVDKAREVEDLLNLSPTEFEKMVVELYTAMGHRAKRTGQAGDHGIDVAVQAKNGEKWVVQCKRWRGSVGEPVIRDFYGAMHHEKADRGAIITTGAFTAQAKARAKGKPITLLEGSKFLEYLKAARNSSQ
jgi:hypothetical protein